ncbi:DUF1330 domain-containing protein [Phyllobacterium sp. P30BS-XVII]|uniref:DUF1330 domain-containing protein n=1 Tax=Phyllobacterium sp. P30BS-XVII TaxID=2587046 RepID=UPI000DDB5041|nr:DUF1330 domain-containing protein [Phyllobacterium sp. P30BS-XVII]MBA8899608.1 uncharacterized protein (DUF1330 family) [Phyllobacterium sp. P30BS-XVII]
MVAYIVITREKTRSPAHLESYKKLTPPTFQDHPAIVRASNGRHEVFEGPDTEGVLILEFPTYAEASAWYHSPTYQAASEHRFQGADYRIILTEGSK